MAVSGSVLPGSLCLPLCQFSNKEFPFWWKKKKNWVADIQSRNDRLKLLWKSLIKTSYKYLKAVCLPTPPHPLIIFTALYGTQGLTHVRQHCTSAHQSVFHLILGGKSILKFNSKSRQLFDRPWMWLDNIVQSTLPMETFYNPDKFEFF
jgi:hypothetical protein